MLTPRNEVASVTSDSELTVLLRSLLRSFLSNLTDWVGVFSHPLRATLRVAAVKHYL